MGHLMRCLALAQAWRKQGGVVELGTTADEQLLSRWFSEGITVHRMDCKQGSSADSLWTIRYARQSKACWVVADGYQFGAEYQYSLKSAALRLALLDDFGNSCGNWADVLINQNSYATPSLYPTLQSGTSCLFGTKYALLRSEFTENDLAVRAVPSVATRLVVSLGGGDPHNITRIVLGVLKQIDHVEARVAIGAANLHFQTAPTNATQRNPGIRIETNIMDMRELMEWADFGIVAAGSICWELAFMGVPALGIVTAENQRYVAEDLESRGVLRNLGWYHRLSTDILASEIVNFSCDFHLRASQTSSGRKLVDGYGARRVVEHLRSRMC